MFYLGKRSPHLTSLRQRLRTTSEAESSSEESEIEIPDHKEPNQGDLRTTRHNNHPEAGSSGHKLPTTKLPTTKPRRTRNHASKQPKGHTPQKVVKDENFYKERLPRDSFQKISNPVQFLRRCAVYRDACQTVGATRQLPMPCEENSSTNCNARN